MTLRKLRQTLITTLNHAGIESPELDARWIIEHVTGLSRSEQILAENDQVTEDKKAKAISCLDRRIAGAPLDIIFGFKEFYGLRFEINEHVLSPRPETEMLVDFVLNQTKEDEAFRLLDLGTGSGAIVISILAHRPNASAIAVDISEAALEMAAKNAKIHQVANRLSFIKSSWASALSDKFDIVVSNPPYIDTKAMTELSPEVRDHDPEISLHGGEDGLEAYRSILSQLSIILKPRGRIAVEIGYDQGQAVSDMFADAGLRSVEVSKDLSGNDRMVTAIATN